MSQKKHFKNGVEYYVQFGSDTPVKLAESTEKLDSEESIERSMLRFEIGPYEDSNVLFKVGTKEFKIFSKEKE